MAQKIGGSPSRKLKDSSQQKTNSHKLEDAEDSVPTIDSIPKVRKPRSSAKAATETSQKTELNSYKKTKTTVTRTTSKTSSKKSTPQASQKAVGASQESSSKNKPPKKNSSRSLKKTTAVQKKSVQRRSNSGQKTEEKAAESTMSSDQKTTTASQGKRVKTENVTAQKFDIQNPYIQSSLSKTDLENRSSQLYTSNCLWDEDDKIDDFLQRSYEHAYKSLHESVPEDEIGEYIGIKKPLEDKTVHNNERLAQSVAKKKSASIPYYEVATHLFDCTLNGYKGWRWFVTVARSVKGRPTVNDTTISEVGLLPGEDALVSVPLRSWDRVHIEKS